jgi:hypothetical protein
MPRLPLLVSDIINFKAQIKTLKEIVQVLLDQNVKYLDQIYDFTKEQREKNYQLSELKKELEEERDCRTQERNLITKSHETILQLRSELSSIVEGMGALEI